MNLFQDASNWAGDVSRDASDVVNAARQVFTQHNANAFLHGAEGVAQGIYSEAKPTTKEPTIFGSLYQQMIDGFKPMVDKTFNGIIHHPLNSVEGYLNTAAEPFTIGTRALGWGLEKGYDALSGSKPIALPSSVKLNPMETGVNISSAFDSLQHMYRATEETYQQHGSEGVTKMWTPIVAGSAIAAIATRNPEVAAEAASAEAGAGVGAVDAASVGGTATATSAATGLTAGGGMGQGAAIGATEATAADSVTSAVVDQWASRAGTELSSSELPVMTDAVNATVRNVFDRLSEIEQTPEAIKSLVKDELNNTYKTLSSQLASVAKNTEEAQALWNIITNTDSKLNLFGDAVTNMISKYVERTAIENAAAPASSAARFVNVSRFVTKPLGLAFRGVDVISSAPSSLGAQISANIAPAYPEIWEKTKKANANFSTIGRAISQGLTGNENSWLSGAIDGIVSLAEAPLMAGRASALEKGAAGVVTSDALSRAWENSPRYRNAVYSLVGKSAGEIVMTQPELSGLADEIAHLHGGKATAFQIHKFLVETVAARDYMVINKIPAMGIYGVLKQAKLANTNIEFANKFLDRASETFGWMPRSIDEGKLSQQNDFVQIGKTSSLPAIGQLLRVNGKLSGRQVSIILDELAANPTNRNLWVTTIKNGVKERYWGLLDKEFMGAHSAIDGPMSILQKAANERDAMLQTRRFSADEIQAEVDAIEKRIGEPETVQIYHNLRSQINEKVDEMFGGQGATSGGPYQLDPNGNTTSELANNTHAAVLPNQFGKLYIPSYRNVTQEFRNLFTIFADKAPSRASKLLEKAAKVRKQASRLSAFIAKIHNGSAVLPVNVTMEDLMKQYNDLYDRVDALTVESKQVKNSISGASEWEKKNARRLFSFYDISNRWVNDKFFKPLALLTPGWALRVSGSELSLNTARLGPGNIAAGYAAKSLVNQQRKIYGTALGEVEKMMTEKGITHTLDLYGVKVSVGVSRRLGLVVRGLVAGVDKQILNAIGKEEYIKAATYLSWKHDSWLPETADSRHAYPGDDLDLHLMDTSTNEEKGTMKTQRVSVSGRYINVGYAQTGYWDGWHNSASLWAADDLLGRPLAQRYLEIVEKYAPRGKMTTEVYNLVHAEAVLEAKKIIEYMPEDVLKSADRYFQRSAKDAEGVDPITSWAETATRSLEGVVMGRDKLALNEITKESVSSPGLLHVNLLRDISNDSIPAHFDGFIEKHGIDPTTKKVWKSTEVPAQTIGRVPETYKQWNAIDKISSSGHDKILGPVVNHIVRQPVYIAEYVGARKALEQKVADGLISSDQADVMAETRAAQNMIRFIHNTQDKTKLEEMLRGFSPFYFAQNQAWRRMGRLFSSNPGAFAQYYEAMMAVQSLVTKTTAKNGMSIFVFPGSVFGVPFTGSLSSLTTMDPFSSDTSGSGIGPNVNGFNLVDMFVPKWGPLVTVPAHILLIDHLPGHRALGQTKIGGDVESLTMGQIGMSTPIWESFFPNSVMRNIFEGSIGYVAGAARGANLTSFNLDNAYVQAQMEAMRSEILSESKAQYKVILAEGKKKHWSKYEIDSELSTWAAKRWDPKYNPTGYQKLLDNSNNRAGLLWAIKIGMGMASPVSVGMGEANPGLRAIMDKYTAPKSKGGYGFPAGLDKFYEDHPYATSMTIFKTQALTAGKLPETKSVYNFTNENMDLVQNYPDIALAYGPDMSNDSKIYQPAVTQQLALNLRARETPADFVNQYLIAQGNNWYYNDLMPIYTKLHANPPAGVSKNQLYTWKQNVVAQYGSSYNSVWMSNHNTYMGQINRSIIIQHLKDAVAPGNKATDKPQYAKVNDDIRWFLANGWPWLQSALDNVAKGKTTSTAVREAWQTQIIPIILKDRPGLKPAVDAFIMNMG